TLREGAAISPPRHPAPLADLGGGGGAGPHGGGSMTTTRAPQPGRPARLTPPAPAQFPLELVALTDLSRRWCNLVTHDEADAELRRLLEQEPLPVLNGLSWLVSAWAILAEARTGGRAEQA